jgi:hypothetical protein
VLRGVVVAGPGLDRSEKRATVWTDLKKKKTHAVPIPAGFQVVVESHGQKNILHAVPTQLVVSGGGGKKRKKKTHGPIRSQLGFRWWWKATAKKIFPRRADPAGGFRWWWKEKKKKKEIPRRLADPMVSGGGRLRKEKKVLMKVVINCEKRK